MSIHVHQYACMLHDYDYGTTTTGWVEELEIEEVGRREYLNVNEFTVPRHKRWPVYKSDNAKRHR